MKTLIKIALISMTVFPLITKADINVKDKYGNTLLIANLKAGNVEKVKALVDAGADLDIQDEAGRTALIIAVHDSGHNIKYDRATVVKYLIAAGAKLDIQDKTERTALIEVSYSDRVGGGNIEYNTRVEIVRSLIDSGAKLDIQDKSGSTALMYASDEGFLEIARLLIISGANRDLVNNSGETAYSFANEIHVNKHTNINRKKIFNMLLNPDLATTYSSRKEEDKKPILKKICSIEKGYEYTTARSLVAPPFVCFLAGYGFDCEYERHHGTSYRLIVTTIFEDNTKKKEFIKSSSSRKSVEDKAFSLQKEGYCSFYRSSSSYFGM